MNGISTPIGRTAAREECASHHQGPSNNPLETLAYTKAMHGTEGFKGGPNYAE